MTTTHVFWTLFVVLMVPAAMEWVRQNRRGQKIMSAAVPVLVAGAIILPVMTRENVAVVMIITVMTFGIHGVISKAVANRNAGRTLSLLVNILIGVFVLGHPAITGGFNHAFLRLTRLIGTNPVVQLLSAAQIHAVLVALAGSYLAAFEINHPIALILKSTNLMPPSPVALPDRDSAEIDEPARGRVIGCLERTIVFLLVLTGHMNAIGYVLVAKGIARFQQLDDRGFAEYFLIGTLLSTLLATLAGLIFKAFM